MRTFQRRSVSKIVCEFCSGTLLGVWVFVVIIPRLAWDWDTVLEGGTCLEKGESAHRGKKQLNSKQNTDDAISDLASYRNLSQIKSKASAHLNVFCAVMIITNNGDHVRAINLTYGKRCDRLVFYSSMKIIGFEAVIVPNAQAGTWTFLLAIFEHMAERIKNVEESCILFVDDMTYVVIDNLIHYVKEASGLQIAGRVISSNSFWRLFSKPYLDFSAGVVIKSHVLTNAMHRLSRNAACTADNTQLRYAFIDCFTTALNIPVTDACDADGGGHRFLPESPVLLFEEEEDSFWFQEPLLDSRDPARCCSDLAITFGSLPPRDFYLLEYLIYRLRPYGHHF